MSDRPEGMSGRPEGMSDEEWVEWVREKYAREEAEAEATPVANGHDSQSTPDPALAPGETLDDFYAYLPKHKYIYVPTRELWPADSINDRFSEVEVGITPSGKPIKVKPSIYLAQTRAVQQMTWLPSPTDVPPLIPDVLVNEGGWIAHPGARIFNLYLPPPRLGIGDPGDAQLWLDHIKKLYPDNLDHIVRWFAHRVQRPWEKINHALFLGGETRIGKDAMIEPVKRAIGHWNFKEASPTQVMGRFNSFVKGVILRISETRDLGDTDRYAFYEHMKTYIAAPPDVLRVDEKNILEHAVFNVVGVIETSNYKDDGMYLPASDARHYVAWSECTVKDFAEEYFPNLWSWYDNGGAANVAAYLAQPKLLEGFNPKAPPPKTRAFWEIVSGHAPPEELELLDIIKDLRDPFSQDLAPLQETYSGPSIVTLSRIIEKAPINALGTPVLLGNWLKDRRNSRQIPPRLKACGYIPVRNPAYENDGRWVIAGKRQVVYGKVELKRSELISLIERAIREGKTVV